MFCPDELRVNRFKQVCLPSNESLFGRIPERKEPNIHSADFDIPASMSKIDSLVFMDQYDSMMQDRVQTQNDSSSEPHEVKRNEVSEES